MRTYAAISPPDILDLAGAGAGAGAEVAGVIQSETDLLPVVCVVDLSVGHAVHVVSPSGTVPLALNVPMGQTSPAAYVLFLFLTAPSTIKPVRSIIAPTIVGADKPPKKDKPVLAPA